MADDGWDNIGENNLLARTSISEKTQVLNGKDVQEAKKVRVKGRSPDDHVTGQNDESR